MSISSMNDTELFAQLTDEQQEVISGGNGFQFPQNFGGNFGLSETSFLQNISALNTVSAGASQFCKRIGRSPLYSRV